MSRPLRHLELKKPQGPSLLPAWALKEGASEFVPHLSFIINQSIREISFPKSLKKTTVKPLSKKETQRIRTTIDQFQSHHVYQKFLKPFSETKL